MGSIRAGKLADFAVLDRSPLAAGPMAIRDMPVWERRGGRREASGHDDGALVSQTPQL